MSVIEATINASAEVADLSNNLAETLYVYETERSGSISTAETANYLNFVGDFTRWANGLAIAAATTDTDGSASIVDVAKDSSEATVFSWTDVSDFASNASLYDVRFTSMTSNNHGTIDIADFITVSTTDLSGNASTIRESDLHFTVGSVTNTVTTADITNAGTVDLTTEIKSAYWQADPRDSTVSKTVTYSCPGGTIKVVKEDNILAADKIGFGAVTGNVPAENAVDVLYDEYSPAESDTPDVSGSVTSMTLDSTVLTNAIQDLLSGEADLADLNDLQAVKNKLDTFNTGEAADSFKGFKHNGAGISLDCVVNLGGTSETLTATLTPQIFFHEYETGATAVQGAA